MKRTFGRSQLIVFFLESRMFTSKLEHQVGFLSNLQKNDASAFLISNSFQASNIHFFYNQSCLPQNMRFFLYCIPVFLFIYSCVAECLAAYPQRQRKDSLCIGYVRVRVQLPYNLPKSLSSK